MADKKKTTKGRPSKYKEEYCELLIKHMEQGLSFETFGATIGVSKQTLYDWVNAHSLFLDAKKTAFLKCQLFWEQLGIDGVFSTKASALNTGVWVFNMKNRFGWRDKIEIEQTVAEIKIEISDDEKDL